MEHGRKTAIFVGLEESWETQLGTVDKGAEGKTESCSDTSSVAKLGHITSDVNCCNRVLWAFQKIRHPHTGNLAEADQASACALALFISRCALNNQSHFQAYSTASVLLQMALIASCPQCCGEDTTHSQYSHLPLVVWWSYFTLSVQPSTPSVVVKLLHTVKILFCFNKVFIQNNILYWSSVQFSFSSLLQIIFFRISNAQHHKHQER